MSRSIIHIDMDAFFVSVERVLDPSLEGKPVIVGGNPEGRGVVASASYEARKFGVRSAMPLSRVKRLCPNAIFIMEQHKMYSNYSRRVRGIFESFSPLVEMVSLDEGFIDVTGTERLSGTPLEVAEKIRRRIATELGLPCSAGIASNKLVAKIASAAAKPNGILEVYPGTEEHFLAPMPIEKIPGIGKQTATQIRKHGFTIIEDLQIVGEKRLVELFDDQGRWLFRRAKGIGSDKISTGSEVKSVSHEHTFDEDVADKDTLMSTLLYLTEKVAKRLRNIETLARTATLKLRYSDFRTITRSKTLSHPTSNDIILFRIVSNLFEKEFSGRKKVRLIGVAATNLSMSGFQLDFLSAQDGKEKHLLESIDKVKDKYGFSALLRARSMSKDEGKKE